MFHLGLTGKRIAIAGLREEGERVAAVLDSAEAFCRIIDAANAVPASPAIRHYDLLIATPDIASAWRDVSSAFAKPVLAVGKVEDFQSRLDGLTRSRFDFLIEGASPAELALRAAALVASDDASATSPAREKPLILTADDDPTVTSLVRSVLSSDGMACEVCNNGGDALRQARALKPDIVVLDVHMPQMTGFEVLSAIRQDTALASTRVVLLTGAEQESDIMRGFALGAADYVVKPFNPMELLVRVRRFVRRS